MEFTSSLLSSLQTLTSLVATVFGVGFIIAFHELGHFLFARLFGICVPVFSIGFGPKLYSRYIGKTEFSVSAIPIGGYVDLTPTSHQAEDSIMIKPWYQKMLVMIGGIGFNLIFAFMTFWLIFILGAPKSGIMFPVNATTTIGNVIAQSAAEKAGLQVNDTILAVNGIPVLNDMSSLVDHLNKAENKSVELIVQRKPIGQHTLTLAVGSKNTAGRTLDTLGASFNLQEVPSQSLVNSFSNSMKLTWFHIKSVFHAYLNLFKRPDFSQLGGPIMILRETMNASYKGTAIFFLVLALISINLAILNLIPLPILDGGQMLFYSIEAIIRRPLSERMMDGIRLISWLSAVFIGLFLSAHDILRITSPYIERLLAFLGMTH